MNATPRTSSRGRRWGIALVLLLAAPAAWAEPKDDARRHFVAGLEAAAQGDYQTALDRFLAAQAAYPHPATLYNIARSYTDLGDYEKALEYFRLYRDAAPEKAADVDPVIAVVEARLRQQRGELAPAAAPPAPAAEAAAAVASAEAERLKAIAQELTALSEKLAQAPAPVEPAPAPATPPAAEVPALPPESALLSDAYERVVVTASRYGQAPLDSPSTVTVLTEQDIRLSGVTSIPDLLRRVAGVDVMSLAAGQPDVGIRGFNRELSNKVLVLVDGRSVYVDFLGNVLWGLLPISLEEVERIEIIRGPGSAIYGANAVSGVINILTRNPGDGRSLVAVEAGTPGYLQGTVLADGKKGPTRWRFSAGWHQVGRWSEEAALGEDSALVPYIPDLTASLRMARANARIDRTFAEKGLASLSGGYAAGTLEFYALGALGDYVMDVDSGYLRGDLAYGPVHLRSFYDVKGGPTGRWMEYAGSRTLETWFDSRTLDVELEAIGEGDTGAVSHRVNGGLGYRYKSIEWPYLEGGGTPIDEHHLNAFLQEEARWRALALVGSLRVDRHPLVPLAETISPRGAAIVRVAEKTSVRATGGTAFRSPTFLESYLDLDQPTEADGVYVRTLGDRELSPERILTAEVGVHDESTEYHRLDVAVYANRVTQLIGLTDLVPEVGFYDPEANGFSAGYTGFANLDLIYTALGAEAEAKVFPLDGLDLYGNVAVERVLEDDGGTVVPDGSTSLVKVNGGVAWRTPWRADLAADVSYVSPQRWRLREFDETGALIVTEEDIDARTIVSARLGAHPFADDGFELAIAGWNLLAFGEPFREHPKGQLVGPMAWGEATWRF